MDRSDSLSGTTDDDRSLPAASAVALAQQWSDVATVLLLPTGPGAVSRLALLAVQTLDSCDVAGLCPDAQDRPSVASPLMDSLNDVQVAAGHGPCADARNGPGWLYVPDLLEDPRWPVFAPAAVGLGVRSVLAYRLDLDGVTRGVLQLYSHLPFAFNAHERAQGLIYATYAALAVTLADERRDEQLRIDNLQAALTSREVIGQAQGILMERERITADQAFALLRRASQHLNQKLRSVAQDVVDTGTTPTT